MKNILSSLKKIVIFVVKSNFPEAVPKKESHVIFDENLCPCYIRFDLGTEADKKRLSLLASGNATIREEMATLRDIEASIRNIGQAVRAAVEACLDEHDFAVGVDNGQIVFKNTRSGKKIIFYIEHNPTLMPDWFAVSFTPLQVSRH